MFKAVSTELNGWVELSDASRTCDWSMRFLCSQDGAPLNCNFVPLDIQLENWEDLPEAFSKRRENRIQVWAPAKRSAPWGGAKIVLLNPSVCVCVCVRVCVCVCACACRLGMGSDDRLKYCHVIANSLMTDCWNRSCVFYSYPDITGAKIHYDSSTISVEE